MPPNAMTMGNATGSTQIAGAPSCAPHRPTAIMATTWSSPEIGCRKPLRKLSSSPLCTCACAAGAKHRSVKSTASTRAAPGVPHALHCAPLRRRAKRWMLQNAPSASHRVARQRRGPAWPVDLQDAKGALEQQHQQHECQLPDLDPDVEAQERERQFGARQTRARQSAREPEAVQQSEGKRHHPRVADGEARLPAPDAHDLRTQEQNAQGNRGVERRHRDAGVAERRERERDAVGEGEGAHRLHQHPAVLDDQQQTQHEQQMIGTKQDVPDSLGNKGTGSAQPALGRCDLDPGLRRAHDRRPAAPVQ